MAVDFTATYKILVLGDSNVGKTCIVHRFCDDRYYETYTSTIGEKPIFLLRKAGEKQNKNGALAPRTPRVGLPHLIAKFDGETTFTDHSRQLCSFVFL